VSRAVVWALVLLVGGPSRAEAPDPRADGFAKRTAQWVEKIGKGDTVHVSNPYGDIYSRFGGYDDDVEVVGTFQRVESDKPELEVAVTRPGDGLSVIVGFAGAPEPGPETRDRVDLVVFLPKGATLDATTTHGAIEAERIQGNVVAHSIKGNIRLRAIRGRVQAHTARGRIGATLETEATEEPQELSTETGDIECYLWEDANMKVSLATSGLIGTDFTIKVEHERMAEPNKRASAVIGHGGPRLTLNSKEGQVALRRLQRGFRLDPKERPGDFEDQDSD
jgi:hypothetical protein